MYRLNRIMHLLGKTSYKQAEEKRQRQNDSEIFAA